MVRNTRPASTVRLKVHRVILMRKKRFIGLPKGAFQVPHDAICLLYPLICQPTVKKSSFPCRWLVRRCLVQARSAHVIGGNQSSAEAGQVEIFQDSVSDML